MDFNKYELQVFYPIAVDYTKYGYINIQTEEIKWYSYVERPLTKDYMLFNEKFDREGYEAHYKECNDSRERLDDMFKTDLLEEYGIEDNQFSRDLVDLAISETNYADKKDTYDKFSKYAEIYEHAEKFFKGENK